MPSKSNFSAIQKSMSGFVSSVIRLFHQHLSISACIVFSIISVTIGCATATIPGDLVSQKPQPIKKSQRPFVVAHRGASGYLPEHTLEAYVRGMELGADYVEPDLVLTKDGVLVARHENEISETTNVAQIFPNRKATKTIDDIVTVGWFTEDFTLAELKTLKAKQRLAFRQQMDNQPFLIPTLSEIIDAVDAYNTKYNKSVGIFPEIKHSTYFRSIGMNMEQALINLLKEKKWNDKKDQIYIQSFEVSNLKELAKISSYHLVQLIGDPTESPFDLKQNKMTYQNMVTMSGLKEIRTYAQGIAPFKKYLVIDNQDKTLVASDFLKNAQLLDFQIVPYTFRNESFFILKPLTDPVREYELIYSLGVDGVFSDFPDTAIKALKGHAADSQNNNETIN